MARSVWKGPFVERSLLKKVEDARKRQKHGHQNMVASFDNPAAT
jgi:ribosomal protein S19